MLRRDRRRTQYAASPDRHSSPADRVSSRVAGAISGAPSHSGMPLPRPRMATAPLTFAVALAMCTVHSSLAAQIPKKFENLRVLPKDITRDSLLTVMFGFTDGLGVQCAYCHSGGDPNTLVGVVFKSDDKRTKLRARAMYSITSQVNEALRANGAGRQLDVA